MNSGGKPAVQIFVVEGKRFQRHCYSCSPVLLEADDGNGYNGDGLQAGNLRFKVWEVKMQTKKKMMKRMMTSSGMNPDLRRVRMRTTLK